VVKPRATLWALSLPPSIWLGLFFVVPLILIVALSFRPGEGEVFSLWTPTLNHYQAAIDFWRPLRNSIAIAFVVAVLAIILAYPVAYFLVFHAGRAAGFCLVLLLVPFLTSFLLRVMSWKYLLSATGLGGFLYSNGAIVIALIYVWVPFAALPIAAALQSIDPELSEAAVDLGASPWQRFRTITLPLSAPGILATLFMVFIPTVGEYVTPELVGGADNDMYGNYIQSRFENNDYPQAAALSAVMLVVTLLLVVVAASFVHLKAVRISQRVGATIERARFPLLALYFAGMITLLYLPLVILFLLSFKPGPNVYFPFQGFTLEHYKDLLRHPEALPTVINSFIVAAGSSCVATALGTAVALLNMRFDYRGGKLLFALAMLPLVVPAIILAVALRQLLSQAGIDRSLWTVAVAHSVVALPYVILIVSARLASFDPDLEEAAMDLGAPYRRVIVSIVLPLIAPSIVSAWLVAFTVSVDEVAVARFLYGDDETFPVFLLGRLRLAKELPTMFAFAAVMILVTMLFVLTAEWVRKHSYLGYNPVDLHAKK
jgi:putative spermidine/putrescine transport system permease protein